MSKKNSYLGPLFIIGILFFVMGFVTWVNGTLITFFKKAFSLDNTSSYLVTFAFFISYTVMAIPCSMVLKKVISVPLTHVTKPITKNRMPIMKRGPR